MSNLIPVGMTKVGKNGNSKSITIPHRLFKVSDYKIGDNVIVYYDDVNDCIIIKKGGM